ncbi:MAG: hypothetical protein NTX15_08425 [Candidatus Kapabacteria bacterium]|nr:hypothetical protein [Candidatus Kapabacteria bacterium]
MFLRILCFLVVTSTGLIAGDNKEMINEMFATKHVSSYPAASFTAPRDFAIGQWVSYGMVNDDDERSIMISRVIGHDGDEWTIESEIITKSDRIITQYSIKGLDVARKSGKSDDMELTKIKIKTNDGEALVIDGFVLSMAKAAYGKSLKGWTTPSTVLEEGGDVLVSAGSFKGTTKIKSETAINGADEESTSYAHPAVPIYGIVKSISGDEFTMELLEFGDSGAKASF